MAQDNTRPDSDISWAESAVPADILEPSTVRPAGWQDKQSPGHNEFNWIQRELGRWIAYQQQSSRSVLEAAQGLEVGEHRVVDIGSHRPGAELFRVSQSGTVYTPIATDGEAVYCITDAGDVARVQVSPDDGSIAEEWSNSTTASGLSPSTLVSADADGEYLLVTAYESVSSSHATYLYACDDGTDTLIDSGSVGNTQGDTISAIDGESVFILNKNPTPSPDAYTADSWAYSGSLTLNTPDISVSFNDNDLSGSDYTLQDMKAQGGRVVAALSPTTGDDIGVFIDFFVDEDIDEQVLSTDESDDMTVEFYEDRVVFVTDDVGVESYECARGASNPIIGDQVGERLESATTITDGLRTWVDGGQLIWATPRAFFVGKLSTYSLAAETGSRIVQSLIGDADTSDLVFDGSLFYGVDTVTDELLVFAGPFARRRFVRVAPSQDNPTTYLLQPTE